MFLEYNKCLAGKAIWFTNTINWHRIRTPNKGQYVQMCYIPLIRPNNPTYKTKNIKMISPKICVKCRNIYMYASLLQAHVVQQNNNNLVLKKTRNHDAREMISIETWSLTMSCWIAGCWFCKVDILIDFIRFGLKIKRRVTIMCPRYVRNKHTFAV